VFKVTVLPPYLAEHSIQNVKKEDLEGDCLHAGLAKIENYLPNWLKNLPYTWHILEQFTAGQTLSCFAGTQR
jgi:hypothetical protein